MNGLLVELHPVIASEWHPVKNTLVMSQMSAKNPKKVWWQCEKGHEWEARISDRTRSGNKRNPTGCPFCSGKKILQGFNDLSTLRPDLAKEWHPTKNLPILPNEIGFGMALKVHWVCSKDHEWTAPLYSRGSLGTNCPVCAGQTILPGFNDLATLNPVLALDWHPTKNGTTTPLQVSPGNNKKVWWRGTKCGHEWEAVIASRSSGKNCPICSNHKIIAGVNDLDSLYPAIAAEWHPNKNGNKLAETVGAGYTVKVWWQCEKGHEWQATPAKRTQTEGTNCPFCSNRVSKAEHEIFAHLTNLGLNAIQSDRKTLKGKELDIYLPDNKFAIEFNGLYYHTEQGRGSKTQETVRTPNSHYDKWLACKKLGIQLIQIWEDDWKRNKEGILKSIEYKLGINSLSRIYARETKVVKVSTKQAKEFLAENHIQGFAAGSYYIALQDKSQATQAIMVLKRDQNSLNIIRYATKSQVVGGFTKLLKHAEKTYQPDSFYTFSDHTISDGSLYANNGFSASKELPADYMYVVNGERKHKFGYRLKRFKNDPDLLWQENLTERELAILNHLPRVWDAGKTKWEKKAN